MRLTMQLCLPRDAASVRVVRHVLRSAMAELAVEDTVCDDLELALGEACGNVVRHAAHADEYDIIVSIDDELCAIDVTDSGTGFDTRTSTTTSTAAPSVAGEDGRGLFLIRALTDRVAMRSSPQRGSLVHFEKRLRFAS